MNPSPPRLTDLESLRHAAECLRILAHPHRLRMIQMLLQGDYAVGELAQACDLPTPMASEHLRLMQHCGFLSSVKEGRRVYYKVAEPHLASILGCIEARFDPSSQRSSPGEQPGGPGTQTTQGTPNQIP